MARCRAPGAFDAVGTSAVSRGRDLTLLTGRVVLGGYLAVHGAQKLFGSFGGPGIERVAGFFDQLGLRPGRPMAIAAGLSEFGGGLLTMAGLAHPLGPVAISGTMAVAASTHRANGPLAAKGGYELPLTNLAAALALAASGPGRYSLDGAAARSLPRPLIGLAALGAAVSSAVLVTKVVRTAPPAAVPAGEAEPSEADDLPSPDVDEPPQN
jgi:putative oxidoreductase